MNLVLACLIRLALLFHIVDEETTDAGGYKVKRRPVKVIKAVGSIDEKFPKNRGLPEVVSIPPSALCSLS